MKNNFKHISLLLTISIVILLTGCLGGEATPQQKALNDTAQEEMVVFDPDDGIADLSERLEEMKADKLAFYVPNSYGLVREKFDWILNYNKDGGSEERLYKEIKETEALIERAYKRKKMISSKMSSVVDHYNTLLSLKSNIYFADRFESLSGEMKDIINDYDATGGMFSSGEANVEALEDVPELSNNMLALEIDTVLAKEYIPNESKLVQMEDNDFDDYAPTTYRVAQLKLIKFKSYIKSNHLNKDGIAKMKASLMFEFSHLTHLVAEVKYLISEDSNEKVILEQERKYLTMMNALGIKDSRDKALPKQYSIVLAGIKGVKATASAGIAENISKIAKLEEKIKSLQAETKVYKEQELAFVATTKELNMEIVTLKMKSENLSKELATQKAVNKELLAKKSEELQASQEKQKAEAQKKQEADVAEKKEAEVVEKQEANVVDQQEVDVVEKQEADITQKIVEKEKTEIKKE